MVERVNKAEFRDLVQGGLTSMCKAPDINPMTLKGRKDARREEEASKKGRKKEEGTKGTLMQKSHDLFLLLLTGFSGPGFSELHLTTARVSCLCAPHRALSFCRMNSGGDRPLVIVQLLDYATDSRIY